MKNLKITGGIFAGLIVGILSAPLFSGLLTKVYEIDSKSAVAHFNKFDEESIKSGDLEGVRRIQFDQKMFKQLKKANRKLGKPDYLRLYFGEDYEGDVGFIVVGFDDGDAVNLQVAGVTQDEEEGAERGNNTDEMYYIKGRVNPTCPKMCDLEAPFDRH